MEPHHLLAPTEHLTPFGLLCQQEESNEKISDGYSDLQSNRSRGYCRPQHAQTTNSASPNPCPCPYSRSRPCTCPDFVDTYRSWLPRHHGSPFWLALSPFLSCDSSAPTPQMSASQILDVSFLSCASCGYQWTQLSPTPTWSVSTVCLHLLFPSYTKYFASPSIFLYHIHILDSA